MTLWFGVTIDLNVEEAREISIRDPVTFGLKHTRRGIINVRNEIN